MIPIKVSDDTKRRYSEKVNALLKNVDKPTVDRFLIDVGITKTIEEIIIAPFEDLKTMKKSLPKECIFTTYKNKRSALKNQVIFCDAMRILYELYDDIEKAELINDIGVMVCPYCNREFINNRNDRTSAQFDHFYPRSKFPIFAISLFNLVPACYACNHIKGVESLGYSPYEKKNRLNSIKFSFSIKSVDYLTDKNAINVELRQLKTIPERDLSINIEKLKLDSAYAIHTDVVQELIKKAMIYPSSKQDEILKDFPGLFDNKEELQRVLFGNYIESENFNKRPLSKMTSDILLELEMFNK